MASNELTFGEFVEQKRKALEITMRGLADKLNIAPAYMCNIEKGRRSPPKKKLEELATILKLDKTDREQFYDLAARFNERTVSADIADYIMQNGELLVALRKAKDNGYKNKDWKRIAEDIN